MEILVNNGTLAATLIEAGEYSTEFESGTINNDGSNQYNTKRARSVYINRIASYPYVGVDLGSLSEDITGIDLMTYNSEGTLVNRNQYNTALWGQKNILLASNEVKFRFSLKYTDERQVTSTELASMDANVKVIISDSATRS